jgi:hypothetical protein
VSLQQEERTVVRLMSAMEIDKAITDLCRIIADTAVAEGMSVQYAGTLGSLIKARRALREAFSL